MRQLKSNSTEAQNTWVLNHLTPMSHISQSTHFRIEFHRKRPRICANQRSRAVHCAIQIYQTPINKKVRIDTLFETKLNSCRIASKTFLFSKGKQPLSEDVCPIPLRMSAESKVLCRQFPAVVSDTPNVTYKPIRIR